MSVLHHYLLSITAASFLLGIASVLMPGKQSKKLGSFLGTLIMILVILSPLVALNPDQMAKSIAKLRLETEELRTGIDLETKELQERVIKKQSEAYVLDKAKAMEVDITVDITLRENQGVPYPYRVCITGFASEEDRRKITRLIETDLGIPAQRQTWKDT